MWSIFLWVEVDIETVQGLVVDQIRLEPVKYEDIIPVQ